MAPTAQDIVKALGLKPHPEKGYFVETFRDNATMEDGRAFSTQIYYLLEGKVGVSNWHRVTDAVETWHHYAGAPLRLSLSHDDGEPLRHVLLGPDVLAGQRPQAVVQVNEWQHAESTGDWSLVGCTVAPAFTFNSFQMAEEGWEPRSNGI
ncbi:cupin family protein [Xylariomycetidae sp. FL0641]|nr:cupin family protein [Xylariomycetidae sp. FL0641]